MEIYGKNLDLDKLDYSIVQFDQCAHGLTCKHEGNYHPVKKPTQLLTNAHSFKAFAAQVSWQPFSPDGIRVGRESIRRLPAAVVRQLGGEPAP